MSGGTDFGNAHNALQNMLPDFQARFGKVCLVDLEFARQIVALLQMTIAAYTPPPPYAPVAISALVFEFIVLRYLIGRGDTAIDKQDLYALMGRLGVDVGGFPAFNTRLTKLKVNERVTWVDNKQNVPVTVTPLGVTVCEQLSSGGSNGLKREDYETWAPRLTELLDIDAGNGVEA